MNTSAELLLTVFLSFSIAGFLPPVNLLILFYHIERPKILTVNIKQAVDILNKM